MTKESIWNIEPPDFHVEPVYLSEEHAKQVERFTGYPYEPEEVAHSSTNPPRCASTDQAAPPDEREQWVPPFVLARIAATDYIRSE